MEILMHLTVLFERKLFNMSLKGMEMGKSNVTPSTLNKHINLNEVSSKLFCASMAEDAPSDVKATKTE